jgi:hypothetical protein
MLKVVPAAAVVNAVAAAAEAVWFETAEASCASHQVLVSTCDIDPSRQVQRFSISVQKAGVTLGYKHLLIAEVSERDIGLQRL